MHVDEIVRSFSYHFIPPARSSVNFHLLSFCNCLYAVTDSENTMPRHLSPDIMMALQGVRFIAQHIKNSDKDLEVRTATCQTRHDSFAGNADSFIFLAA